MLSILLAQKKSEPCKRKSVSSDLGILYSVPEISYPNFNFKLCWREILLLALRITYFWRQLGFSLGLEIPGNFLGDPPLTFPVGVYYDYTLLENYTNHQKDKIAYVPLDPVSDYVYIADLILDYVLAEK